MSQHDIPQVGRFLHQEINIAHESIELGLKQSQSDYNTLPIILCQYGLVSLNQLDCIYDWFELYIY
jgi:Protein of unknown function (DUF2949)